MNWTLKDDSHAKKIPQRSSKCKGSGVVIHLTCSRERKEPAWLETGGRVGDEVTVWPTTGCKAVVRILNFFPFVVKALGRT